jgi:hypothetical protein
MTHNTPTINTTNQLKQDHKDKHHQAHTELQQPANSQGSMLNVVIRVRGILLSLVMALDFNFLCKDFLLQPPRIDELVAPFFR